MTSKSGDEYFSADSLDKSEELIKKKSIKSMKTVAKAQKRKTYSELNQIYMLREFIKERVNKIKSNSNGPDEQESIKYPSRNSSNESVESSTKIHQNRKPETKSKIPRILWSEFVSKQYKAKQSNAIENSKFHQHQKRIEYGRKISSMNRINKQCQKLHKKFNSDNNRHTADAKAFESLSSIVETKKNNSKALKSSSSSSALSKDVELELKLECMQIRHQNDKKKVEKIKSALMNEKVI